MDDLISRQAAIDATKKVCETLMLKCKTHYDEEVNDAVYDDINEVDAYLKCNKHIGIALKNLPSVQPERKKDIIQKFHDYQVQWLKEHYDLEFEPQLEELVIRFLHDTANFYMMEVENERTYM